MINLLIVSNDSLSAEIVAMTLQSPIVDISLLDSSECLISRCRSSRVDLVIFLSLSPYFTSMNIIEYMQQQLDEMPSVYVVSRSHSQATVLTLFECGVEQYMTFPLNLYRLRDKVYSKFAK